LVGIELSLCIFIALHFTVLVNFTHLVKYWPPEALKPTVEARIAAIVAVKQYLEDQVVRLP
jgi:hypothetical protein